MRADPLEAADQHAEAGGVEELDALHVDDHVVLPGADQVDQLLAELGRGVDVDLAPDDDDGAVPSVRSRATGPRRAPPGVVQVRWGRTERAYPRP